MALFFDRTQGNSITRLGDCWALRPATHPDLQSEIAKWQSLGSPGSDLSLLRIFNQDSKYDYQRCVTVTDRGSGGCPHCLAEQQAETRRQGDATSSNGLRQAADTINTEVYEPLTDPAAIRVLQLEPAPSWEDPLRGSLEVCPDREGANYVALSYTWSGISESGELDLGSGILKTTGNLNLALRALRPKESKLRIWVDAVCINQEDLAEKAIQVTRMDHTYTCANSVVAWLGPATDTSATALESLEILAELSKAPEYDTYTAPRPVARDSWLFPIEGDIATDIQDMRSSTDVDSILDRLWFQRLWVVQEVMLAKDISFQLGPENSHWDQLRRATMMLYTADAQFASFSPESDHSSPLAHAMTLISSRDRQRSMENGNMLMRDYTNQIYGKALDLSDWGCQDDRDRVFAILGFIPRESGVHITPDYTLSTRQVYINFARKHILHEGLLMLSYVGLERRGGHGLAEFARTSSALNNDINGEHHDYDLEALGLPSWIPDLRPDHYAKPRRQWSAMDFAAAMNRPPAAVLHERCPHVLAVRGRVFDAISQPLPTEITRPGKTGIMDIKEVITYVGFVYRFAREVYEQRGGYPTGTSFETVFDNVITADKKHLSLRRLADDYHDPSWIEAMLGLLKRGTGGNVSEISDFLSDPANDHNFMFFLSTLGMMFQADQCIITEKGYMGLAPMCSKLDKIAWINEMQCLVVLRPVVFEPHLVDGQQYQLIGPCFLHGLMQGELLDLMGSDEEACTFIELI